MRYALRTATDCLAQDHDSSGVQYSHAHEFVHDPAFVELLHVVVLLDVERVHHREHTEELRLGREIRCAPRDDDALADLELAELVADGFTLNRWSPSSLTDPSTSVEGVS